MSVKNELLELVKKMNANPEHIQNEKDRVYQVNLVESGVIQIIMSEGQVEVLEGQAKEAEVVLTLTDQNFSKLLKDDLNTTMAFMTGSLKVEGKIGLALKLQEIVKKYQ